MFSYDPRAKPQMVTASLAVHNDIRQIDHHSAFMAHVHRNLADQIAGTLTKEAIKEEKGMYTTTYEVRLYVLTADQLARLVDDKARQLEQGMLFSYGQDPY